MFTVDACACFVTLLRASRKVARTCSRISSVATLSTGPSNITVGSKPRARPASRAMARTSSRARRERSGVCRAKIDERMSRIVTSMSSIASWIRSTAGSSTAGERGLQREPDGEESLDHGVVEVARSVPGRRRGPAPRARAVAPRRRPGARSRLGRSRSPTARRRCAAGSG